MAVEVGFGRAEIRYSESQCKNYEKSHITRWTKCIDMTEYLVIFCIGSGVKK